MLETALAIWETATKFHDAYKRVNTIIFGDKQEAYLQQIATDMTDLKVHIEKLSDTLLYAVNLDGIRAAQQQQHGYINDLREIRQLLEPLQQALDQPLLSSAIMTAPHQLESKPPRQVLTYISPLEYVTIPHLDDFENWVPALFEENGEYFVGWQLQARLSRQFGCEYQAQWLPNQNKLPPEQRGEGRIIIENGKIQDIFEQERKRQAALAKQKALAEQKAKKLQEERKQQAEKELLRKEQEAEVQRQAEAERLRKEQEAKAQRQAEAERLRKEQEAKAQRPSSEQTKPSKTNRYIDNGDGTVTDNRTGLIWLKNASCFGKHNWEMAMQSAAKLADGQCGLSDGSKAGDWRLPILDEWEAMIDKKYSQPVISNAAGTDKWQEGDAFSGVQTDFYWSYTPDANVTAYAWFVYLDYGNVSTNGKAFTGYVWPVRRRH